MDASSAKSMQLSKLPLFPLQTVLFPDGVLPLRIFELRYLDMSVLRSERQKFGPWVGDVEPVDADAVVPVPDDLAFAREALRALVLNIGSRHRARFEGAVHGAAPSKMKETRP